MSNRGKSNERRQMCKVYFAEVNMVGYVENVLIKYLDKDIKMSLHPLQIYKFTIKRLQEKIYFFSINKNDTKYYVTKCKF